MNLVVNMVIRKNLLHKLRVNRESDGWLHPLGFLRHTAKGKMKVFLSGFRMRFGGLAGKKISSVISSTLVELAGLVKKTYKMIEATSL